MNEQVWITVESTKDEGDGQPETMQFETDGRMLTDGAETSIIYDESELTGMQGTTTTLKVTDGSVMLIRSGKLASMMIFEEGKTHYSAYDTEFGSINIGVSTKRVQINLGDVGGHIAVDYVMEFNSAFGGRNTIRVDIKRKLQ